MPSVDDFVVEEIHIPDQQLQSDGKQFPLVLSPTSSSNPQKFVEWIRNNKDELEKKSAEHGCILFRGFGVANAEEFLQFTDGFQWEYGSYMGGGGPRNVVLGPIHTSTESPPEFVITFHHELAYLPSYPGKLFFFCEIPPAKDGETPILYSNRLYEKIKEVNPDFIRKLEEKKVRYTRYLSDVTKCERKHQRGWQEIYGTEDREEATKRALSTGTEKVEWKDDTMIVHSILLDGVLVDNRFNLNGKRSFFNSVVLLHPATLKGNALNNLWQAPTYGDFSPIEDQDVLMALEIMQKEKVAFPWQKGDVLLVDNRQALHSRNSFTPPRRILAAIIK